jgi:hypothetical protein
MVCWLQKKHQVGRTEKEVYGTEAQQIGTRKEDSVNNVKDVLPGTSWECWETIMSRLPAVARVC